MSESIRAPLRPEVARRLGWYVYLYRDPRTNRVFYVGKGRGARLLAHMEDERESEKVRIMRELSRRRRAPKLEVLVHGLSREADAYRIEAAVIDALGIDRLSNAVRGHGSKSCGLASLEELAALYGAKPVKVADPVLLIRINRLFHFGMSKRALYEATRGIWKLGDRREAAQFAFAVFEGVVREVYRISGWHPAGSTRYQTRKREELAEAGRVEFTGRVAPELIRKKYIGRSVRRYFLRNAQSPCLYVNC